MLLNDSFKKAGLRDCAVSVRIDATNGQDVDHGLKFVNSQIRVSVPAHDVERRIALAIHKALDDAAEQAMTGFRRVVKREARLHPDDTAAVGLIE